MKQIKETDNELIAEFMGAERREGIRAFNPDQTIVQWIIKGNPYNQHRDDVKHWYQPVELKYHQSWDWLMPVVEKIADLYEESDHDRHWNKSVDKLRSSILFADIVVVHQAVVYFIRWHNTQNQTN